MRFALLLAAAASLASNQGFSAADPAYQQRWFYAMYNLQVAEQADQLIALIERAAKAGYNGVVLADYKLNILDRVPDYYFKNLARVKKAADEAKVEIIPTVMSIGYSAGLLAHDPNLAEGVLAKNTPFVVRGREAVVAKPDDAVLGIIRNGDLEEAKGDQFVGFSFQDDIGKTTFVDRDVKHGGKASLRMQDIAEHNANGSCRISQRVKVRPQACYRFSAWVKTENLKPTTGFKLLVLGTKGGRQLTFYEGQLKPTADWQPVEIVFNTVDQTEVQIYAGQWGGRSGKLWVDDLKLEELGLMNVLRRPGCPLNVASEDGAITFEEGRDFETVKDPQLGNVPYAGEYSFRHDGPAIRLTAGSRIADGQRLAVSWYHPIATHTEQVMCCLTEPKVYDILRDQTKRVHDALRPKTFFMSHDEIRVAGWCEKCQAAHKTPGELLAENVKQCVAIVKQVSPEARLVVWSDMFDPHHNAVDKYYFVNGTLAESWKGLPPEVTIANWNGDKAAASLKFFADRGHTQILAGYYDADDLSGYTRWHTAARGVKGVEGFMYTTWEKKFKLLEEYGKAMEGTKTGKD